MREAFDSFLDDFGRHGSGSVADDAEAGEVVVRELGVVEDLLEHSGNHARAVGLFALNQFHPLLGFKLAGKEEGAATVDGGEGRLDAGDVVHGQGQEVPFLHLRVGGGDAGEHV